MNCAEKLLEPTIFFNLYHQVDLSGFNELETILEVNNGCVINFETSMDVFLSSIISTGLPTYLQ